MLSPEVLDWPSGSFHDRRRVRRHSDKHKNAPRIPPMCDTVTVMLKDTMHCPDSLRKTITADNCPSYVASGVKIPMLTDQLFVKAFVNGGKLTLSTMTKDPRQPYLIVQSPAMLSYGFTDAYDQRNEVYVSDMNSIKDKDVLRMEAAFPDCGLDIQLLWRPSDPQVCPSSIAKYFHDRGATIKMAGVEEQVYRMQNAFLPSFDDGDTEDIVDTVNDLAGRCMLGVSSEEIGQDKIALCSFKGVFDQQSLKDIWDEFSKQAEVGMMLRFSKSGFSLSEKSGGGNVKKNGRMCWDRSCSIYQCGDNNIISDSYTIAPLSN